MTAATEPIDVALIGGGIMSATLGTLLKQLQPDWSIRVYEALNDVAQESSNPWNNAGTGHSALCELNYSPQKPDGSIDITSAIKVNEQFQVSRQFWSFMVGQGSLPEPEQFINPTPHMSFVWGSDNVEYLRKRFETMQGHPLFQGMEFSDDPEQIAKWAPALIPGRNKAQPIAATHILAGTDVDFGSLTRNLFSYLTDNGAELHLGHRVTNISRERDRTWRISLAVGATAEPQTVRARFVFVGAGGGALNLLQKSGIPEIRGFGGFPVSGEFLRTDNPAVVVKHQAKVYGKASVGAPPMSVPHLDTRVVDGSASLMFGPYAGFSPKFLKSGSYLDLFKSIRLHNLYPMIRVALSNIDLLKYLISQLAASKRTKFDALTDFMPDADPKDWYRITAGQRVQVIKADKEKGGVLQFGTEVVTAKDGSIAGLLGASPGASTAVPIMLTVLERCFPSKKAEWAPKITAMIPTAGTSLAADEKKAAKTMSATAEALHIHA
ncbi:malate:quinone oxidoreductase [Frondihabitans australicus]|uniref:Probable malate:quinone oxidoreductase n=1 Tax=Frondihabitans australicus TaxID=386892 RepID=A0A495ICW0_9MICO|nr:malate:quinone oxidoreductase [Frondihabitans australicus]RKR73141.1 malate dehydrogenase (quinone) [Frondihabitans australicus]